MMYLISILAAVLTVCSSPASGLLEKMQNKIASMGTVEISVSIQGTDASVVTDGNRYWMNSDVMQVWCDGTNQWIYNAENREMTVTEANSESVDIFENPALVLTPRILDTYSVASEQNGSVVLKVRKNLKVNYPQITVQVGSNSLPGSVTLKSSSGETYEMKIVSFKSVSSPSSVSYSPSEEFVKKSFLNDMR